MELTEQLLALGSFALYFAVSLILLVVFKHLYPLITPHNEWQLIKEKQNTAAAIALGGAILGFALALGGAASNSVGILDYLIWAVIALLAQMLAFIVIRFVFMPKIVARIENDEVSAGIMVAVFSVAVGLLNAACMTY